MARVTGLEPAASGVTGRRSNQLSYTPQCKARFDRALRRPTDLRGIADQVKQVPSGRNGGR
jgi:hypothetical protein